MTGLPAEMVDDLVSGAAELAAEMVGWPEDHIAAALADVQENLCASLSEDLGTKVARIIATAFARTVVRHRADLQVAGVRDYGSKLQ
jgi:hypothetical protein